METGVEQRAARPLAHTLFDPSVGAALSLLLVGLALWVGVVRWRIVLEAQGLHLPLGRATRISFVAQFFNSFLLGSTGGDLIKAYYAARETHHKKTEAVTTVFVDRLVGLWAMLLFAGLMMAPNYGLLRASRELGLPSLFILAMLGVLTVVLGVAFWGGVSKTFPRARSVCAGCPRANCWSGRSIPAASLERNGAFCQDHCPLFVCQRALGPASRHPGPRAGFGLST